MSGNDIKFIRDQARMAVDPLLLKLRMELYGSGVSYGKYLDTRLVAPGARGNGGGDTDSGFIAGISVYSGGILIGTNQKELNIVGVDEMFVVDGRTTIIVSSGQFNAGLYYTKSDTDILLTTKSNTGHTHIAANITDFDVEVANNTAVAANTAKVTNQFHTGDVTGDTYLTIANKAITPAKFADSGAIDGQSFVFEDGDWTIGYPVSSGTVSLHAPTHAIGGIDPVSPSDIGAATASGLSTEIANRIASVSTHASGIASTTVLGHIKVGANLSIDGAGVLSAIASSGLIDPSTSAGDLIIRNSSNTSARLPIGTSGTLLRSNGVTPYWATPLANLTITIDGELTFTDVTTFRMMNTTGDLVGGEPQIRPGFTVQDISHSIIDNKVHTIVLGSGITGIESNAHTITVSTDAAADLAAHEVVVATPTTLGHVKTGTGILVDNDGLITWSGVLVRGTAGGLLSGIKELQFLRQRVQASGLDAARVIPAIRTETVTGELLDSTEILYFGAGITATASGTGRVVLSAGSASDFIIQTVTSGVTDKAPSSNAIYNLYANHNHDDRYYTKDLSDARYAASGHVHIASQITDFDTEVSNNVSVVANTAKISNATHVGEVTGSGILVISSGVITPSKMSIVGANEGNTLVYQGGVWGYSSLSSVAISSGVIDGGSFTSPGALIKIMRGGTSDLPLTLNTGEFGWDTTLNSLWLGSPTGNKLIQDAQRIQGRDVVVSSPVNGQALVWNSASSRFENSVVNALTLNGIAASGFLTQSHTTVVATTSGLGHIQVGTGLQVTSGGILSLQYSTSTTRAANAVPVATASGFLDASWGILSGTPSSAVHDQIMNTLALNNSDPIDQKIVAGDYIVLIYFGSHNAATWKAATNAIHTVTTGKKLIVMSYYGAVNNSDTTNRRMRLWNVTDSVEIIPAGYIQGHAYYWAGDTVTASRFPEIVAGKQVRLDMWNGDSNRRAIGGYVICREV